jgi:hypothetical protein
MDARSTTSLLRDSYHDSSKLFLFCIFTISAYFIYSIEAIVHWIFVVVLYIYVLWYSIFYSFHSTHKSGSVVSEWSALHFFSLWMSPTRFGYKKLGLEPVEPLQDRPCRNRPKIKGDEKKYYGVGDPFKMFLEEALAWQRNEMMDNFAKILRWLPTREASSSSGRATPFKVKSNFDIPLFEGLIDADVVDKWLNLIKGYFWVHNFFVREKITFVLLKAIPHVKDWWDTYYEKKTTKESAIFSIAPTWDSFRNSIKEQYYPIGSYED